MAAADEPADVHAETTRSARRGEFGRLWTAAVFSRFGDALRTAALPLRAASLTGQPLLLPTRWLGLRTEQYMAAMTLYTVSALAGGALAARLVTGLGRIRSTCLAGAALAAIGGMRSFAALATGLAVFGMMGMVWNVNPTTLMQQRGPAPMLGRISSAFRTVAISGALLGALLGGAATTAWGLNSPPLLAAVLFALTIAPCSPLHLVRSRAAGHRGAVRRRRPRPGVLPLRWRDQGTS